MPEEPGVPGREAEQDPMRCAIADLVGALQRFAGHTEELLQDLDAAHRMRETGASYRAIAERGGPFIGEATGPLRELLDAVGEYRRCQARALYGEGMTMAQLGRLLGITRQRVAVLLDEKRRGALPGSES